MKPITHHKKSAKEQKSEWLPKNPAVIPRFAGISTFSRLPTVNVLELKSFPEIDVGIVGIPFDGGTTYRSGARFGPRAIRQASCLNRNYSPSQDTSIYEKLKVADLGDVACNPLNMRATHRAIQSFYKKLLSNEVTPIGLGGDHSVLLPILREMQSKHGRFGLIQFDAHSDTADQAWGEKYHHGTPIRRAIEEGLVKGADIFQIGLRGPLSSKEQLNWDKNNKINQVSIEDFNEIGLKKILSKINRAIPYYFSFDIDGVDPAFAPGTGTPVVGGLSSYQALQSLRQFKGLRFIGFDVVEVSPEYDHAEITSLLASAIVFEFMALLSI